MEKSTRFGLKISITLPLLANKYFNTLKDEVDEPIYTYNDDYMRYLVRQNMKGGRCTAFNQYYKSIISNGVFDFISKELDICGKVCEIFYKFFEFTNKHRKIMEDEYDLHFEEYRDNNQ